MSTEASRRYHYNEARTVANGIARIRKRINPKYTPIWMLAELDRIDHKSQCILAERRRILKDFDDKIPD